MQILDVLREVLGIGSDSLNVGHMALRAAIIYVTTIAMVRLGEKRFLGENTAFDFILGIILGSIVSRAITGSSPFLPTIAAGFVLVIIHWLFAVVAFRLEWFASLIKGHARTLIEDGDVNEDAMRKSHIGRGDLRAAAHALGVEDIDGVQDAYLERSGAISVIPWKGEPQMLEIDVADGVQTVRIRLE